MARVVDDLRTYGGPIEDQGRFSDYPWDEWTDGNFWEITQGEDFVVSLPTMRVYLYQWRDLINQGKAPQPKGTVALTKAQTKAGQIPQWAVKTRIVDHARGVIRFRFRLVEGQV